MMDRATWVARSLTPPFLWSGAKAILRPVRRLGSSAAEVGTERDDDYYDETFESSPKFRVHYTRSPFYVVWVVVADRVRRAGTRSVLDIGCGSGQVASMLRDRELESYCGIDFSRKRISWARKTCPEFRFVCGDFFEVEEIRTLDYDTAICTEVLEHIDNDLGLLEKIPADTRVIATVPNFFTPAHVRAFNSCEEVRERYGSVLKDLQVDPIVRSERGKIHFLLEGTRA